VSALLKISTPPSRLRYKDFQQNDIAMRSERIKVYKSRQIQRSSAKTSVAGSERFAYFWQASFAETAWAS
jgi:hypothetical protein